MKTKKALILAVIFTLLTSIFAMSDDGESKPLVEKKEVKQEVAQIDKPVIETKSGQTVKDEFGIDTGMTKEELDDFKESYHEAFPFTRRGSAYKFKIDYSKKKELKELGVEVFNRARMYKDNALFCDVVVIGKVTDFDKRSIYKIEIDEILKGEEVLKNKLGYFPDKLYFKSTHSMDNDNEPALNTKGIYFLWTADKLSEKRNYLQKLPYSTVISLDDSTVFYERYYEEYSRIKKAREIKSRESYKDYDPHKEVEDYITKHAFIHESWDEIVNNIKKILEVNDAENFYKKSFRRE